MVTRVTQPNGSNNLAIADKIERLLAGTGESRDIRYSKLSLSVPPDPENFDLFRWIKGACFLRARDLWGQCP